MIGHLEDLRAQLPPGWTLVELAGEVVQVRAPDGRRASATLAGESPLGRIAHVRYLVRELARWRTADQVRPRSWRRVGRVALRSALWGLLWCLAGIGVGRLLELVR